VREPRVDRRAHLWLGVKRSVNGGRVTRRHLAQHRENPEDAFEFALMEVAIRCTQRQSKAILRMLLNSP
jgi:transposase-like protein